jgi:hypothetical protein
MENKSVEFKIVTTNQEIPIQVSKIISVRNDNRDKKSFIYFEEMNDGTFRMTYSSDMIKDV